MPYVEMTWANREHAPSEVELVCAWDEYSIDANSEGYAKDRREALDSMGDDLLRYITLRVEIPFEVLHNALNPPMIKLDAKVV